MTIVYLITNNCFMNENIIYKDYIDFDTKRKNRPLTMNGEKVSLTIAKRKNLQDIEALYASTYFSSVNSAKYLANKLNVDMIIDKRLDDRIVGNLADNSINLRNLQEHDFDYKLDNGESLNDVKSRMTEIMKEILKNHEDSKVAIYTHNIPMVSLLTIWCEKGFNYEEKLILNYKDDVIIDGLKNDYNIIELTYEKEKLNNIKRIV